MKKYRFCFLLFFAACIICTAIGYFTTRYYVRRERAVPNTTIEMETMTQDQPVINQNEITNDTGESQKEQYFLVAEDGFLLVFCEDKKTVCLHTHMPVVEFPEEERNRLMKGIWFSNMLDIFNYLESYSS